MNSNQDDSRDPDLVTALIGHSYYSLRKERNTLNRILCLRTWSEKKRLYVQQGSLPLIKMPNNSSCVNCEHFTYCCISIVTV